MAQTTEIRREQRVYNNESTRKAEKFVADLRENVIGKSGTFDSAASNDFLVSAQSQNATPLPESIQAILDEVSPKDASRITRAILDGAAHYEAEHGVSVPADIMEYAMHMAYGTTNHAKKIISNSITLDSASNVHADNLSLQPNRAVVAILAAMNDAIPFALYLPADISSNEARTAILSHQAGATYGMYQTNGLLDGANSGMPYLTPSRRIGLTVTANAIPAGQLSSTQTGLLTCGTVGSTNPDGSSVAAVPLLRGRSLIYIGGQIVGGEATNNQSGTGNSNMSGTVTIAGTTYTISGTINTTTGAIALTSSGGTSGLPNGTVVVVEGFIDYEAQPLLTPNIISNATVYQLFAKPWRVVTQYSPDASTQMNNELGLDPYSESLIAIQNQFTSERHYEVLAKGLLLGANNTASYDFMWASGMNQGAQKTRAMIVQDMQGILSALSQQMAINTMAYGISHLYVDQYMAGIFQSLPSEMWEGSGVQVRPGIYRVGRLFNQYEVYYAPKVVPAYSGGTSAILCFGRAPDVTRNPFILGDAVPPTVIPLGVGTDLRRGAGFYARNFTDVNPHLPSSLGCAILTVQDIGL